MSRLLLVAPFLLSTLAHAQPALVEGSIEGLQRQMESGATSAIAITRASLDRIERFDRAGPRTRAIITTNPDAVTIARDLDTERKRGKVRGPLHGITVLVKDNLDTGDKMMT